MNVGTEQIKHLILRALKKHKANLRGIRYGEFADDLSNEIYELFGGEMLELDLLHDVPLDLLPLIKKLERGLGGFSFPRDKQSLDVYRWISEQPKGDLQKFIKWATAPDRVQYVGKYRKNTGTIQFDWEQAVKNNDAIIRNEDGSINV